MTGKQKPIRKTQLLGVKMDEREMDLVRAQADKEKLPISTYARATLLKAVEADKKKLNKGDN